MIAGDVEIKKWGNSFGIIIPAEKVKELDLHKGDKVNITISKKKNTSFYGVLKDKAENFSREDRLERY